MECVAVNKKEILSEANKLVSNGLRKAAIDLLLEYLESDPNSSHVLSTLGRAYLLDHQPDKAVICLKRSLEVTQSKSTKNNNLSIYQSDNFCDDDITFVESQAEKFCEEDYSLEVDEPIQPTANKETQISSNDRSLLSIGSTETGGIKSEEKNRFPHPKSNSSVAIKPSSSILDDETTEQPAIDENRSTDWVDDEGFALVENEQLFSDELFEDDNDDQDEEALDELAPTFFPSLEEESDELIWDDFEDLDEFDELAHQEAEEEVQDDGKISREARARQIAVEVLDKSDWELKHLSLLQQIFIENGWSAARRAIEREIGKGLWPEELSLARKIRLFWLGNEQCWMTFQKIKHNAPFQQADAAYKCMSWPESLRIIRCFPSLPDIEEIYMFIDEVFDHWYNSKNLRRIFPAFFKFLKYRVDSMRRALPDETVFSFLYYVNASSDVDTDMLNNSITPESQEILELGFQLNQWPRSPENKMKIIRESDE